MAQPDVPSSVVHLRIEKHDIGQELDSGRQYVRGRMRLTKDDLILLPVDITYEDAIALVRQTLMNRSTIDLARVFMNEWPKGAGPGTGSGGMSVKWKGVDIPVHNVNWTAIRQYLMTSEASLDLWFFVLPEPTVSKRVEGYVRVLTHSLGATAVPVGSVAGSWLHNC